MSHICDAGLIWVNHDILSDDESLRILGYELMRADHPSNQK